MKHTEFMKLWSSVDLQLMSFALKLTKNKANASDLYQDTVMKALAHFDHFQQGTNFKAWVTTIMYNHFINEYRRKVRRSYIDTPSDFSAQLFDKESYLESIESKLMVEDVGELINRLNPPFKESFTLYLQGHKYKEIGEKLNIPIGTVKSRINVARKELIKQLNKIYGNDAHSLSC